MRDLLVLEDAPLTINVHKLNHSGTPLLSNNSLIFKIQTWPYRYRD